MLYLAEVQKQKTGFMGTAKAELKLLACQRADQSWNPVPGEEIISASLEEANKLSDGALVLADLNPANRQVQRIQEAGRPLVGILQNFSRQLEKSKSQEEEIEQWKQSLTFQSQELNRREMEMEARLEQLQQVEEDFERLEAQRQEIDVGRETSKQLREEIERNRQELEGAWEHLRGEQRRLEERHTELQPMAMLDEATQQIQELFSRLSSSVAPTEVVRDQLQLSFELVSTQQSILDQYWQQMEQQRNFAQQQQGEVDHQSLLLQNRTSDWQQAQNSLEQARADLQAQTLTLNSKRESAQILGSQLHNQEELYQQVYRLAETSSHATSQKVDKGALEKMPLDQLQQLAQDLERDLAKVSQFVHDQEEELRLQHQTIEELQARLSQAAEHERQNVEAELAEQHDCYQMLNETLVGQRRNLQEREEILNQHQSVLRQRQGGVPNGQEDKNIDPALKPILLQIEGHKQQQAEELQRLELQIEQMQSSIQQFQGTVDHQSHEQEMRRQELQNLEQNLLSLRAVTSEAWGRVNLYQQILQPVQDSLNGLRQALEAITSPLAQMQVVGDHQLQTIAQLQQTFLSLT